MKCEYCGREQEVAELCRYCGARPEAKKECTWNKSEPFFYNGYIVYALRDASRRTHECQFWLGRELIERIEVADETFECHVGPYEDCMPFFWNLFLLAHGEKEVITWQERNSKLPATFEVRYIENPERERLRRLSMDDVIREMRIDRERSKAGEEC